MLKTYLQETREIVVVEQNCGIVQLTTTRKFAAKKKKIEKRKVKLS
jgi:hypothetical protein